MRKVQRDIAHNFIEFAQSLGGIEMPGDFPTRVLLMVDQPLPRVSEILAGAVEYSRAAALWCLRWDFCSDCSFDELREWRPDGVLVVTSGEYPNRALRSFDAPIVSLGPTSIRVDWPHLALDQKAIGTVAANHLLEKSHRQFVAILSARYEYQRQRVEGFQHQIREHKLPCFTIDAASLFVNATTPPVKTEAQEKLSRLPKPLGVFAATDQIGFAFCEWCCEQSLRVPEEIAVVAAGDQDGMAELSRPTLSTVTLPWRKMGFEASKILFQLLRQRPVDHELALAVAEETETRGSTEFHPVGNPDVAAACTYIRQNLHKAITVDQLARKVSLSRRVLELRFKEHLHRTPMDLVRAFRLERARKLLSDGDDTIDQIARACGFSNTTHLGVAFRRAFGISPSKYRMRLRGN